jgi:hypothetical protein
MKHCLAEIILHKLAIIRVHTSMFLPHLMSFLDGRNVILISFFHKIQALFVHPIKHPTVPNNNRHGPCPNSSQLLATGLAVVVPGPQPVIMSGSRQSSSFQGKEWISGTCLHEMSLAYQFWQLISLSLCQCRLVPASGSAWSKK